MDDTHLIRSKINRPSLEEVFFCREELVSRAVNDACGLILIQAPGGYGKTVLAAQIADAGGTDPIWVRLDSADNDPAVFFYYLFQALAALIPPAEETLPELREIESGSHSVFQTASFFLRQCKKTRGPLTLILDDFHLIQNPAILEFTDLVIKYLPESLRLILTARRQPMLDLAALRLSGRMAEFGCGELCFSFQEFIRLMEVQGGLALEEAELQKLEPFYRRSEGWPLALSLCAKAVSNGGVPLEKTLGLLESGMAFSDFFADQVFDCLEKREQEFLLRVSVLDQMTPEVCAALSGCSDARELLRGLERKNAFLCRRQETEETYACHPLFRDFLADRLGKEAARWSRAAGDCYLKEKQYDQAVEYYIRGACPAMAAQAFRFAGIAAVRGGRLKTAEHWICFLCDSGLESDPRVLLAKSLICLCRGMFDTAEKLLGAAWGAFSDGGHPYEYGVALTVRSRILLYRGSLDECISCAEKVVAMGIEAEADTLYEAFMQKSYGQILKGDFDDGIVTLETGIELMNRRNCGRLSLCLQWYLAVPHFLKFQYHKALSYYRLASEMTDEEINLSERFSVNLYGARLYRDMGMLGEARELMEKTVRRKQRLGYEEELFVVYYHLAVVLRDQGDYDQAMKYVGLSGELFRSGGSKMEFSHLLSALKAQILSDMGFPKKALELAEDALKELVAGQSKFMADAACYSAGIVALRCGEEERAEKCLRRGYEKARENSLKSMLPACAGVLAGIYMYTDISKAASFASASLGQAAAQGYLQVFLTNPEMDGCLALGLIHQEEPDFVGEILGRLSRDRVLRLLDTLAAFGDSGSVVRFLRFMRTRAQNSDASLAEPALCASEEEKRSGRFSVPQDRQNAESLGELPALILRFFGDFKVYSVPENGAPIRWRTQKAQELLAYFAHYAGQDIRTEKLLADLWPDHPQNRARDLFYTNLSLVRKVLEHCGLKDNLVKIPYGYRLERKGILCDEWIAEKYRKRDAERRKQPTELFRRGYLENIYSDWAQELKRTYDFTENL